MHAPVRTTADVARTAQVLWAALLVSIFIYVGILLVTGRAWFVSPDAQPVMAYTLAAVALATSVVSFVLPPTLHRQAAARMAQGLETREEVSFVQRETEGGFRDAAPGGSVRVYVDRVAAERAAAACAMTPFILSIALSESVGIHGLLLAWLGHGMTTAGPLLALSFALIAVRFPTRERFARDFERATGTRLPAG